MDAVTYIISSIVLAVVGLIVLYFVIKAAIKSALTEDRAAQVKAERMAQYRASETQRVPHLDVEGA